MLTTEWLRSKDLCGFLPAFFTSLTIFKTAILTNAFWMDGKGSQAQYLAVSNERKYEAREAARGEKRRRCVRRAKAGRSEISTKPTVSCQKISRIALCDPVQLVKIQEYRETHIKSSFFPKQYKIFYTTYALLLKITWKRSWLKRKISNKLLFSPDNNFYYLIKHTKWLFTFALISHTFITNFIYKSIFNLYRIYK